MVRNYESRFWGLIYDQMMESGLAGWLQENRTFYGSQLQGVTGPVLECACGTGLVFLPLLSEGCDIHGFDASDSMLTTLRGKAQREGLDVSSRISQQQMETFEYPFSFDAILIPTNSFGMLTTQDAQIQTLSNIRNHLRPGGRLLLDLRLQGVKSLAENSQGIDGRWHEFVHPDTGRVIRQRLVGAPLDLANQIDANTCIIEYDDDREEFPMDGRWIFGEEFQLLLRLSGFSRWEVHGSPEGGPIKIGLEDTSSFWIATR